jgi:hypothetical protein
MVNTQKRGQPLTRDRIHAFTISHYPPFSGPDYNYEG